MRIILPLLLLLASCSKHNSSPAIPPAPVDSTDANTYLDPGTVNASILSNNFNSFNLIHAYDNDGFFNITAKALVNGDTCMIELGFPDTLHTNTSYANYAYKDNQGFTRSVYIFTTDFFDAYLGTVYLSGVDNDFTGDTLVITNLDRSKHLLAGSFKTTLTASTQESPIITQNSIYITGTFNTYYNTAK